MKLLFTTTLIVSLFTGCSYKYQESQFGLSKDKTIYINYKPYKIGGVRND